MNKISSSSTFFYKRVLPIFLFGLLTIAAAAGLLIGTISIVRIVILYPVFMMGMYWLVYKRYWNLVDEVFDEGDCLLFQNGGESDRVALSNIMNVSPSTYGSPQSISLRLVNPSKFGGEITFLAKPKRGFIPPNPLAKNPIAEDLIVRVDKARSNRDRSGKIGDKKQSGEIDDRWCRFSLP